MHGQVIPEAALPTVLWVRAILAEPYSWRIELLKTLEAIDNGG